PLRTRRGDLQRVRLRNQVRLVQQRPRDLAHALAVVEGDEPLGLVDGDPQRPPPRARLLDGVDRVPHVGQARFEELGDLGYGPAGHVTLPESYLTGWSLRHTTSRGEALKIE